MSSSFHAIDGAEPSRLRRPDDVMKLKRLGASFPSRLSFLRTLLRDLARDDAKVTTTRWDMDPDGFGVAVYTVRFHGYDYSLVGFSTPLNDEQRSDRVIAEAWDTTFVLYDGIPDASEIERLRQNAPKQEAGRFGPKDLILSRANKSVRFFEHVVESLSSGRQPDRTKLCDIGYLLRTTAVYGNGKFGIADRFVLAERPGLQGPFHAEMLTVWLIRQFSHELAEHVARSRAPQTAVKLAPDLRRHIGVGNSTGLGMAPFLANHPVLLNNWIVARETALQRVLRRERVSEVETTVLRSLWMHAEAHLNQWSVDDTGLMERILHLRKEWQEALTWTELTSMAGRHQPIRALFERAGQQSEDFQELLATLLIEYAGAEVDDLAAHMASAHEGHLEPAMSLADLKALVAGLYRWALTIDFAAPSEIAQFWYVSEEKLEPRLGLRAVEAGSELEMPLDIARQVQRLMTDLETASPQLTVGEFLTQHQDHRYIIRRIQISAHAPYAEIRDNLLSERCLPIDMLRCKLAFFGASKFDPRSDRWTRITLFQGAPTADDLKETDVINCWLPVLK